MCGLPSNVTPIPACLYTSWRTPRLFVSAATTVSKYAQRCLWHVGPRPGPALLRRPWPYSITCDRSVRLL